MCRLYLLFLRRFEFTNHDSRSRCSTRVSLSWTCEVEEVERGRQRLHLRAQSRGLGNLAVCEQSAALELVPCLRRATQMFQNHRSFYKNMHAQGQCIHKRCNRRTRSCRPCFVILSLSVLAACRWPPVCPFPCPYPCTLALRADEVAMPLHDAEDRVLHELRTRLLLVDEACQASRCRCSRALSESSPSAPRLRTRHPRAVPRT